MYIVPEWDMNTQAEPHCVTWLSGMEMNLIPIRIGIPILKSTVIHPNARAGVFYWSGGGIGKRHL